MAKLMSKLKSAAAKRKRHKQSGTAKEIGKKALKAGLVAGSVVAAQVAIREIAVRRGLVKRKAV